MLRKFAFVVATIMCAALILQPVQGQAASQLDKVNKQIRDLQREIDRKKNEQKKAEKEIKTLAIKREETKEEILKLNKEIELAGIKVMEADKKVEETERMLEQTRIELQEAVDREKETSKQLDSRIRLMYIEGKIPYLDVVMNTASFSDFLSSFDDMQYITSQTKDVLIASKEAREQVELKEAEETKLLLQDRLVKQQREEKLKELQDLEKEKERIYAIIGHEIEQFEEISEEAEKELMALASKKSKAEAERNRLETYYKGGKLRMPLDVSYRLTSGFGTRVHPITKKKHSHSGIDMAVPQGTPIYAAESGRVIIAQWWSSYGNCIIIDHGGGLWTVYGHIKNGGILVKAGDKVSRGDKIALVGSTGQSTGPHLHFEVRKNEKPVDPMQYLK